MCKLPAEHVVRRAHLVLPHQVAHHSLAVFGVGKCSCPLLVALGVGCLVTNEDAGEHSVHAQHLRILSGRHLLDVLLSSLEEDAVETLHVLVVQQA